MIIATDEAPQELKSGATYNGKAGFLSYTEYDINNCTSSQAEPDQHLRQALARPLPGQGPHPRRRRRKAMVHMIGGVCKKSCSSDGPGVPLGLPGAGQGHGRAAARHLPEEPGHHAAADHRLDHRRGLAGGAAVRADQRLAGRGPEQDRSSRAAASGLRLRRVLQLAGLHRDRLHQGHQVVASYRRWVKQAIIE